MRSRNTLAIIAGALATTTLVSVQQASAEQYLFDILFGGKKVERKQEVEQTRVVVAPKVSAPTYYTYKVDPLVKVDFAGLVKDEEGSGGTEPATISARRFAGAREALADLDIRAEKDVADAIEEHYDANPDFIWVSGYGLNARGKAALVVLGAADAEGLNAADYAVTPPAETFDLADKDARFRDLIRFEMQLSARVLRYARDAEGGRVVPGRLSGYHDLADKTRKLNEVIDTLAETADIATYLESLHPQNNQYKQLKAELAALRVAQENEIVVDPKLLLKPGGTSAELPKILRLIERRADDDFKAKYGELLAANIDTQDYTDELVPLIKDAQKAAGIGADGVIGPRTVATFAGESRAVRIDKVLIAMEELRWLPSKLGETYVFVNQPAFEAKFIKDGEARVTTRVVIGKATNQTSFFYDEIEQVDYNPYWGVPRSIIVNEMLPKLLNDPGYLDRAGYEVTDAKGRHISSASIDWGRYGANIPYDVRQTPGEANALGELKILFPNKNAIYMHDTPSKSLFNRDMRAFSHGCIRLQKPREMAAAVLQTSLDHVVTKLKQGHSSESVPVKIPIYIGYFTAWPDLDGTVHYYPDVYKRDEHTDMALEMVAEQRAGAS